MSRRAKKQYSDRAPLSGTRSSQRKQKRRKAKQAKPVLAVVPNAITSSSALTTSAAAPAAVEAAPAPALASLLPPTAKLTAEPPSADEALPDMELSFFERWCASAPDVSISAVAEPSPLITDDVDAPRLTPEQQQRRQWFRRQVTALMAGMGALGTAGVALRIASLL
jgi:hypothetical protein